MIPSDVTQAMINRFVQWPQLYNSSQDYDFGWWYAYFWKEAKTQVNAQPDEVKNLICAVVDSAGDTGGPSGTIKPTSDAIWTALRPPLDPPLRGFKRKAILNLLLKMGFRAMPVANPGGPLGPSAKELFQHKIEVDNKGKKIPMAIGYRGVGTTFDEVIGYKGALNRVELKLLNMGEPWHPFYDTTVANKMYYRLGSNDNCLYTVASAADTVKLAVGFPLIEDEAIHKFSAGKPIDRWELADFAIAASGTRPVFLAKVSCTVNGSAKTGVFLATESYHYLFKVTQEAVHTEDFLAGLDKKMAMQCQERGVRRIPLNDFLIGIKARRIHLGSHRTDGIYAFVQEVKYLNGGRWDDLTNVVDPSFVTDRFLGDQSAATVFLNDCRAKYSVGQIIEGERDYGAIVQEKPKVIGKLAVAGAFAALLPGGQASANANFKPLVIKKTGQGAKVGAVEVRAGVADKIIVTAILEWGLSLQALNTLKATANDLYFGRT